MAAKPPRPEPGARERRNGERLPIEDSPSVTLTAGGQSYRCTIEDISLNGASLKAEGTAPDAEAIVIEHPKAGRLTGRCVRRDGSMLGITFDTPKSVLERALQCVAISLFEDEAKNKG